MQPDFFDNHAKILKDDLVASIHEGDGFSATLSVLDACMDWEKRIYELEAQVVELKRKYAEEVQPSKRNAACRSHKQAKAELSLLKGE